MDKSASLYCLPNERTSALFNQTIPRCRCNCTRMSENPNPRKRNCSKYFLKCTPWRRKPLLRATPRWTLQGFNSCFLRLSLLLSSLLNTFCCVFSGTMSAKRTSMLRIWWILLTASFFSTMLLPVVSSQESVQPTPSVKSKVLPNAVVYVGSAFSYNISEDVFACSVDSIVVSCTFTGLVNVAHMGLLSCPLLICYPKAETIPLGSKIALSVSTSSHIIWGLTEFQYYSSGCLHWQWEC